MQYEYLVFNIIIMTGPFILGLIKPFYFAHRWASAFKSIILVGIPFIIWDALVTGSHWYFNQKYVMGITILNLPLEEWLFFLTVPFACLFTWEMVTQRVSNKTYAKISKIRPWLYLLPVPGFLLFFSGLEYTGLVFIFFTIAVLVDQVMQTDLILQKRFYIYLAWILGFTLIFNGFLTWRPVVLYGEEFQIGLRIITIPIEDFGYGISLLFLNTAVFERLEMRKQVQLKTV